MGTESSNCCVKDNVVDAHVNNMTKKEEKKDKLSKIDYQVEGAPISGTKLFLRYDPKSPNLAWYRNKFAEIETYLK